MGEYYKDDTAKTAMETVTPVRKNCFAYCKRRFFDSEYEDCVILKNLYCRNEECKFFKTQEQFDRDQKASENRQNEILMKIRRDEE